MNLLKTTHKIYDIVEPDRSQRRNIMQINLEKHDLHSIQSYNDSQVTVNHMDYQRSIILSQGTIIPDWPMHAGIPLNEECFQALLHLKPELIIIGHLMKRFSLPEPMMDVLFKQRIGVECMPLGAACRTFNVLLNERRAVVLGLIF